MYMSFAVRSGLFLSVLIPSILCSIFVLYYYLIDRKLRTALNNHAIIVIIFLDLFYELTNIIWLIYFYLNGFPLSSTPSFCLTWAFIDYTIFLSTSNLIVWMTFERHIFIFHKNWHSTQRKRLLFHYIPMFLVFIYPFIFYFYVFIIQPCQPVLSYTKSRCASGNCVSLNAFIALWDSIVNYIIPIFLIFIFGAALFLRIFYYRNRAHRQVRWRDYRKLVIQLLPILVIYVFIYFPPTVLYTAYIGGLPTSVGGDFYSFCMYFSYYGVLLTPFGSLIALPELKKKWKQVILFWRPPQQNIGTEVANNKQLAIRRTATVAPMA